MLCKSYTCSFLNEVIERGISNSACESKLLLYIRVAVNAFLLCFLVFWLKTTCMEIPKRTNDILSVKTQINDVINDLDLICRVMAEFVTMPKEQRRFGTMLKTGVLADLFVSKAAELEDLWRTGKRYNISLSRKFCRFILLDDHHCKRSCPANQFAAIFIVFYLLSTSFQNLCVHEIRHSRSSGCSVENCNKFFEGYGRTVEQTDRQKLIDSIQHDIEMNAIFQANLKLRSIKQADLRPVSADDLVRYAHRISSANSVTAPLTWQQGDPERPFPTDLEMRSGWLSRITGGTEFSAPISTLAHPPVMGSHMVSVDNVHALTLPSQSDVSPVASQKLGPTVCWPSPRSTYMPSPRARLPNTCVSPGCVPPIGQRTVRTPAVHNQAIKRDIGTTVEDAVEVLSSDSSSSSSSDSPS
ncbi:hypothetical protein M513_04359 [Trichuris suis]|uniref:Mediator of RNA polymerase II transcription subunit 4 n=1 Tax=Trichuris suis TaxID=68888 RepID=A0A085MBR3_9BILA|nr:hypothetical protein M513_04359 [Trichuris suis]